MTEKLPLPDAKTLAKEFKDFVYSVSHDLSGPSRAIVEFTRLLQEEQVGSFSEDGKLYLSLIVESGQKLQQMLEGLLEYSRLNTLENPVTDVDLNTVLKRCQLTLGNKIKATQATLKIEPLPTIKADAEQIMQLFLLLLDNALKFRIHGKKPSIRVSAKKKGTDWVFHISDNGIGIDAAYYQQIFKPFQCLHSDTEYPGIGMGLALAKKIAMRHGGTIEVESSLHKGSIFTFNLPQREPASDQ